MWKELKFDHPTKRYMHKPQSFVENETHKIIWDFQIQIDHLIPTERLKDYWRKKKENLPYSGFCLYIELQSKSQRKWKKTQLFRSSQNLRKLWNMRMTVLPVVLGVLETCLVGFKRGLELQEIGGPIETATLLKSASIHKKVLETW